jgi:hypothetical protein
MELALNLIWFFGAAATLALFAAYRDRDPRRTRPGFSKWYPLIALCCALIILFFVISVSDDLQDQQVMSEECQPSRALPRLTSQSSADKHAVHAVLAYAIRAESPDASVHLSCAGHVGFFRPALGAFARHSRLLGRAPPSVA